MSVGSSINRAAIQGLFERAQPYADYLCVRRTDIRSVRRAMYATVARKATYRTGGPQGSRLSEPVPHRVYIASRIGGSDSRARKLVVILRAHDSCYFARLMTSVRMRGRSCSRTSASRSPYL
jgi:hypothetical protein